MRDPHQILKTLFDPATGALRVTEAISLTSLVSAASVPVDLSAGKASRLVLDTDVTLSLSNPTSGGKYVFIIRQDGAGGHTVTWPASVKWPGGTPPTITAGAGAVDVVTLFYDGDSTEYIADFIQDFS
jgi:hypothetical protein